MNISLSYKFRNSQSNLVGWLLVLAQLLFILVSQLALLALGQIYIYQSVLTWL